MKKWVIFLLIALSMAACKPDNSTIDLPSPTPSPTNTPAPSAAPTITSTPTATPDPLEVLLDRLEHELVGEIGFSDDGSLLGYLTKTGFYWHDANTYQQLGYFEFEDHEDELYYSSVDDYFSFSPLNGYAAIDGPFLGDAYLIDLSTGAEVATFLKLRSNYEFSSKENLLAIYFECGRWESCGRVFILETQSYIELEGWVMYYSGYPSFTPDANMVAMGWNWDGEYQAIIWDVDSGAKIYAFTHPVKVRQVAFSPDGNYLATLTEDGTVRIWEIATGTVAASKAGFGLSSERLYFGGSWQDVYVQISGEEVIYWDATSGQVEHQNIPAVEHEILTLLQERLAAVPTPMPTPTRPAPAVTPEQAPQEYAEYPLVELGRFSKGTVTSAGWSPDGSSIVITSSQGVYLYNPITLQERRRVETGMWMSDAFFSPDGAILSVGTNQAGEIVIWENGEILETSPFQDAYLPILSPDGSQVFYSTSRLNEEDFYLWDLTYGQNQLLPGSNWFWGYENLVMAYSPNGRYLAATQPDGSVWVWDKETMTVINAVNGVDGEITNFSFSADGDYLIGASGKYIQIWTAELGTDMITIQVFEDEIEEEGLNANILPDNNIVRAVTAAALSPDGRYVAAGTGERYIMLYDLLEETAPIKLEGHTNMLTHLAFNPEGTKLVSVDADGSIFVWQVPSGHRVGYTLAHSGEFEGLLFRDDGNLAAWSENTVWALSPQDARLLHTTRTYSGTIYAASPDGRYLAVYLPDHMELWSFNGEVFHVLEGEATICLGGGTDVFGGLYDAVFSLDSSLLAVDGCNGIWIYSVPSGELINYIEAGVELLVALSPDAVHVVTANYGDIDWVKVVQTGENVPFSGVVAGQVFQNRFTPDGSAVGIVAGGDLDFEYEGSFYLQFLFDDSLDYELNFREDSLHSLAFSPDGTLAAVGSADGEIFFIDLGNWEVLGAVQAHTGTVTQLAFSTDGGTLASGSTDGTVRLWQMP